MLTDPLPKFVFEDVYADLFQYGSFHVLVYAGRLSGIRIVTILLVSRDN